jgi:hypothetical protein
VLLLAQHGVTLAYPHSSQIVGSGYGLCENSEFSTLAAPIGCSTLSILAGSGYCC